MGVYYINNDNQHQRNERIYVTWGINFIAELVVMEGKLKNIKIYPICGNFPYVEANPLILNVFEVCLTF